MFKPDSLWQWLLLAVVGLELVVVLGLESWALYAFENGLNWDLIESPNPPVSNTNVDDFGRIITDYRPYSKSLPTFLALFIFGMIYMLGLAWDALRMKNTIQVIGICCFNWALCLYGILQEVQIQDTLKHLNIVLKVQATDGESAPELETRMKNTTIAVPALLGVGSILVSFIGWKLYHEFAWTIYKHVSADLQLRRRYMIFEIYIAILKFDFFFFLAFTMEFLVLLSKNLQDPELYLTIVAVPVTILVLIAAAAIVRKENKPLQWIVMFFYLVGLAYFLFKLVRIWSRSSDHYEIYAPAAKPLTALAVLTIIMLVLTLGTGFKCMQNFGRGLKPYVNKQKQDDDDKVYLNDLPNPNHPTTSAHVEQPGRMVIE